MNRLISLEPSNVVAIRVEPGDQKSSGHLGLRNVMHTMPVAFTLRPLSADRFSVRPSSAIIPPLRSLTVEIVFNAGAEAADVSGDGDDVNSFLLHSVVVPGAAPHRSGQVPPEWFTAKKKHVFTDTAVRIVFVGSAVAARLVAEGSMDRVREVLERSDPSWRAVDSAGPDGRTLLHVAVSRGRPDLVQLLLEFGAGAGDPGPLEAACEAGEALAAELLLARGARPERSEGLALGPVHLAAQNGHAEVLRLLLRSGAAVDESAADGRTALQIAAAEGDEATVRLLLNFGANKEVRSRAGRTAYDAAAENGHRRLFDELRLGDRLRAAAWRGEAGAVARLLEGGAVVTGRDQHGWTALHRACFKGRLEAVRVLLEAGAEVDARDDSGRTPLHYAAEAGHAEAVEVMLKRGADAGAVAGEGSTAAQMAERWGHGGVARVLLLHASKQQQKKKSVRGSRTASTRSARSSMHLA